MLIFNAVGLQIRQNITVSHTLFSPKRPVLILETPSKPPRGEASFAATSTPPRGRRRGVAFGSASRLFQRPPPNLPEGRLPSLRHPLPLGGDGGGSFLEAHAVWDAAPLP